MNTVQVITVNQINGYKGVLTFFNYEKKQLKRIFQAKCYIGKNGTTSHKIEGDNKTPLGTYNLSFAFGNAEKPDTKMRYIKIDDSMYWVDDINSKKYNSLVMSKPPVLGEHLIDYKDEYKYAIAIDYNKKRIHGKGSAIFLHCIGNKDDSCCGTAGCIAVEEKIMLKILKQLYKNAIIIIL